MGGGQLGELRLRHRRCRHGRLRAREPALGRPGPRCCCSRPAGTTAISGSTSRSAISTPRTTRAPTGASRTEPEANLDGRALNYPRGKVLGGCSSINGMIYMRGQAADYDHWRQLGNPGWSWEDVLPYFMRSEDHSRGPRRAMVRAASGGSSGSGCPGRSSMRSAPRPPSAASRARRLQSRRQRGLRLLPGDPAAGPLDHGQGVPAPGPGRPNLTVVTEAQVTGLRLEGRRCTGVTFLGAGRSSDCACAAR